MMMIALRNEDILEFLKIHKLVKILIVMVNLFRPINRSCKRWTKKISKQFKKYLISADDCRVFNTQDSYQWALYGKNKLILEIISLQINLLYLIVKEKEVKKARFSVWIILSRNKVLINFSTFFLYSIFDETAGNVNIHKLAQSIFYEWNPHWMRRDSL